MLSNAAHGRVPHVNPKQGVLFCSVHVSLVSYICFPDLWIGWDLGYYGTGKIVEIQYLMAFMPAIKS